MDDNPLFQPSLNSAELANCSYQPLCPALLSMLSFYKLSRIHTFVVRVVQLVRPPMALALMMLTRPFLA